MLTKEEIVEALSPFNFWGKAQNTGVAREAYFPQIARYLKAKDIVVALVGVRRAGKTYLTKQALEFFSRRGSPENTLYVLLEDPKFEPYLGVKLLEEIYQTYRMHVGEEGEAYIVLDEVQNVPLWERWVRTLIEKHENAKVIVTGSSSKLLYSRLATTLTGRTLSLEIFPLSFKEFLSFKGHRIEKKVALISQRRQLEKLFLEYITYGGFPQVVLEKDVLLKTQLLREIFEGIIYKDVMARHKTKDAPLAKNIGELAINNYSSLGSASKLRKAAVGLIGRGVSPNLIVQILSYLEEAFLIFQIPVFSYRVKEQKLYPKKFYCIDTGLINAVTFRFSENMGRLYENIAAVSLIRQYGKGNIFYWKSPQQEEVDFAIKEGLRIKRLIQVCFDISDKKAKKRETASLVKAAGELGCKELLVITSSYSGEERSGGRKIIYEPLWKRLLLSDE